LAAEKYPIMEIFFCQKINFKTVTIYQQYYSVFIIKNVTEHKNSFQNGNENSAGSCQKNRKKNMLTISELFF
jgi:hypothetical protein